MRHFFFPLLALLTFPCCPLHAEDTGAAKPADPTPAHRTYAIPETVDDGWETADMRSAGLDPALMNELLERAANGTYKNIHAMLVVKSGRLIFEEYFHGQDMNGKDTTFDRDTLHTQQSVTKSVNSILLGVAIDQQKIAGVEEKISGWFPEDADLFRDEGPGISKSALRLKDCLSMTAGLTWVESGIPYTDPRNDAYGLNRSPDPIRYVLERPMAQAPGQRFLYNTGISVLLGEILKRATNLPVDQFAERHLFGPLGITKYLWKKLPNGSVHTGGGLFLRPRDMAKIGMLYLQGGRWQDKQIVSEAWVHESTKQQAPYRGYGYQWWLHTFRLRDRTTEAYAAQGLGGQFIFVVPELQTVAVFTSWNLDARMEQPLEMLQRYLLPALEGAKADGKN